MDIDYEINLDDYDSVDYLEYSDEFYSREVDTQEYPSKYWYAEF